MRFEVAVAEYMEDRARRLRRTTLEGYESAVRCHLVPRWAGRELEGIGFEELQAWVDGFERPGAAEKAFKTFRQVYRWALRRHQLRVWDVTQGIELPVKPSREVIGVISYGSSAGYVSVHADGTVYCTSKASGDFSGQVCFVV